MAESIEMTRTKDWGTPAGEVHVEIIPDVELTLSDRLERVVINELDSWRNFSLDDFIDTNDTAIAIGIGVGIVSFFTLGQMNAILALLGSSVGGGDSLIGTAITIGQMPFNLAGIALKICFFAFTSILIPYVEEFIFRGVLHEALSSDIGDKATKVLKVVANAFIFTLCHIPILLPGVNAIILMQIFLLGTILASVRVDTENRAASTAAHMTYNGLIFGSLLALA